MVDLIFKNINPSEFNSLNSRSELQETSDKIQLYRSPRMPTTDKPTLVNRNPYTCIYSVFLYPNLNNILYSLKVLSKRRRFSIHRIFCLWSPVTQRRLNWFGKSFVCLYYSLYVCLYSVYPLRVYFQMTSYKFRENLIQGSRGTGNLELGSWRLTAFILNSCC